MSKGPCGETNYRLPPCGELRAYLGRLMAEAAAGRPGRRPLVRLPSGTWVDLDAVRKVAARPASGDRSPMVYVMVGDAGDFELVRCESDEAAAACRDALAAEINADRGGRA